MDIVKTFEGKELKKLAMISVSALAGVVIANYSVGFIPAVGPLGSNITGSIVALAAIFVSASGWLVGSSTEGWHGMARIALMTYGVTALIRNVAATASAQFNVQTNYTAGVLGF